MTAFIKWTIIILTGCGIIYCINIIRRPFYYAIPEGLILIIIVLPLTILLQNSSMRALSTISMTDKKQTIFSIILFSLILSTLLYLFNLVVIKEDGYDWQPIVNLGGHNSWQFVLDRKIGYGGLIIYFCSFLLTSINLRQTNRKIFIASIPIIFHFALWMLIYLAFTTWPIDPEAVG